MKKNSEILREMGFDISNEQAMWLDYWQSIGMRLVILSGGRWRLVCDG